MSHREVRGGGGGVSNLVFYAQSTKGGGERGRD